MSDWINYILTGRYKQTKTFTIVGTIIISGYAKNFA